MGPRTLALLARTLLARSPAVARHAVTLLLALAFAGCSSESEEKQGEDGGTESCLPPSE